MAFTVLNFLKRLFTNWPCFFLCFLGVGFFSPSLPFWAFCFYLFFIPRFVFHLSQKQFSFQLSIRENTLPLFFLLLCFAWTGVISCFWSVFETQSWKWLVDFSCTLLFLWGAWEALQNNSLFLEKLLWTVVAGSAFNEFLGLFLRFIGRNIDSFAPDRVPGWGIFYPIVFAGDLAGLSILSLTFLRYRNDRFLRAHKVLAFALFALNILFLLLTGCRMACLALCCATLLALGFWQKKRLLFCLAVPLLATAFAAKPFLPFLERGDSGHIEIWQKGLAECFFHPWVGEGVRLQMKIANSQGGFFPHPHSFFVALFLQAGGIGFFLFFLSFISLFFIGLKKTGNEVGMCFAVYALLCGVTDLSFVFKGPSEEWILIWLPFLLSVGFVLTKNQVFRLKTHDA